MNAFDNPLLVAAARGMANEPNVAQNRARAAVILDSGYGILDAYQQNRGLLFALGILGSIASGYMLWKRKSAEARALYGASLIASAGLAWVTRPDALRSAVPPPPPGVTDTSGSPVGRTLAWLDEKAVANSAENPGWESQTWSRLSQDLGSGTIPPAVTALLIP